MILSFEDFCSKYSFTTHEGLQKSINNYNSMRKSRSYYPNLYCVYGFNTTVINNAVCFSNFMGNRNRAEKKDVNFYIVGKSEKANFDAYFKDVASYFPIFDFSYFESDFCYVVFVGIEEQYKPSECTQKERRYWNIGLFLIFIIFRLINHENHGRIFDSNHVLESVDDVFYTCFERHSIGHTLNEVLLNLRGSFYAKLPPECFKKLMIAYLNTLKSIYNTEINIKKFSKFLKTGSTILKQTACYKELMDAKKAYKSSII